MVTASRVVSCSDYSSLSGNMVWLTAYTVLVPHFETTMTPRSLDWIVNSKTL